MKIHYLKVLGSALSVAAFAYHIYSLSVYYHYLNGMQVARSVTYLTLSVLAFYFIFVSKQSSVRKLLSGYYFSIKNIFVFDGSLAKISLPGFTACTILHYCLSVIVFHLMDYVFFNVIIKFPAVMDRMNVNFIIGLNYYAEWILFVVFFSPILIFICKNTIVRLKGTGR